MTKVSVYITCPQCGSPDVLCDATARWDFEAQDWSLSGTNDDRTCQSCDYEGYSFHETPASDLTAAQRAFLFEGADYQADAS